VHLKSGLLQVSGLKQLPAEPTVSGSGFAPNAVYLSTARPSVSGPVALYGSWVGSDASVGTAMTGWYPARPSFSFLVAGYPTKLGNALFLELKTKEGNVSRLPLTFEDPRERWQLQSVSLPETLSAVQFRLVAIDGSSLPGGWFGFSLPFEIAAINHAEVSKELALVFLATAASVVFVFFPGLVLHSRYRLPFVFLPVPGSILLAVLGVFSWKGPHGLSPVLLSSLGLWIIGLFLTIFFFRVPFTDSLSATECRVLIVLVALACIGVAKATWHSGPPGELYGGTISRTLEIGSRSDSRVPYHVTQLVATRNTAFSNVAKSLFQPWSFSDRGPLAALAVSPIVLSAPTHVLSAIPDQPWTVYDSQGFAVYRIGMTVLACCSLASVFGLARIWLTEELALLAFLITVSSPFVVHEIYFTWPKLEAAALVLIAAYLIADKRYFFAGLSLGLGYLFHPSALVWLPALFALVILSTGFRPVGRSFGRCLSLLVGCAVWLIIWRIVNRGHFTQTGFAGYVQQAGGLPSTIPNWLWSRYDSLFNTLVPFHVFLFDRSHESVNSIYGRSPLPIVYFVQYWSTLPFGVGITFFPVFLHLLYKAWQNLRPWLLWCFIVPLALFTIYWGATRTGMMREGLHAWFLGIVVFGVVAWIKAQPQSSQLWSVLNWTLLLRGAETLAMLVVPVFFSVRHPAPQFALSDLFSLAVLVILTALLYLYIFRYSQRLRIQYSAT
jgi:hypothetical protein